MVTDREGSETELAIVPGKQVKRRSERVKTERVDLKKILKVEKEESASETETELDEPKTEIETELDEPETEIETELDEKEIIREEFNVKAESSEDLKDSRDKMDESENVIDNDQNIIVLDKYWPEGMFSDYEIDDLDEDMKNALKPNPNLLFICCYPDEGCKCSNCFSIKFYVELEQGKRHAYCVSKNTDLSCGNSYCLRGSLKSNNCGSYLHYLTPCISKYLKYYQRYTKVYLYLDISPVTIENVKSSLSNEVVLLDHLERYHLRNVGIDLGSKHLSDTSEFIMAKMDDSFKLTLRDYQLRTVSWMKTVESVEDNDYNCINYNNIVGERKNRVKLKLGHSPYYTEFGNFYTLTKCPKTRPSKPIRISGGILADDTGSGKTITTLGLIHASPFTPEKKRARELKDPEIQYDFYESRATCIICPSNIYKQWISEAKRCNPKWKVNGFSSIVEYQKVRVKDVIDADILVVSQQFLLNSNYIDYRDKIFSAKHRGPPLKEDFVDLREFYFHRLVLDEYHEIPGASKKLSEAIQKLRADHIWGLTGTPRFHEIDRFHDLIKYFKLDPRFADLFKDKSFALKDFTTKFIKRNVPDLQLPALINETQWVDLTIQEREMFNVTTSNFRNVREQIMMCCHYQLAHKDVNEEFKTLEDVQKLICKEKEKEIRRLTADYEQDSDYLTRLKSEVPLRETHISVLEAKMKDKLNKIEELKRKLNYFESVFKILGNPDENECRICYESIPSDALTLLPCMHVYCFECIKAALNRNKECPLCRMRIGNPEKDLLRLTLPSGTKNEVLPDKIAKIDTSKFGSKLMALYRYIVDLLDSDPNARIILFLQYRDLTTFIDETLKKLGIKFARCSGNVFQRQKAIADFRTSKDVRIIMLSSEDSVSGINLTQATHIILLHPFWSDKNEEFDLAYEKQGISRAYRYGLQNPLKVVRFAVRGTVEEEITLRRQNIKL